ncbi:MAG: hypothetical protein EXS55_00735 [Candidatus Magasanikbacteria bacterium]|nr:hypothetical protein [Candidatus Magasanikbacteria bacterium]
MRKHIETIALAALIGGCGVPSTPEQPIKPQTNTSVYEHKKTVEEKIKKNYEKILENYENLRSTKKRLQEIKFTTAQGEETDGLKMVVGILNKGYDPTGDSDALKKLTNDYLPGEDPKNTYMLRVAHALWVESQNLVPWSLKDYSSEQVEQMLHVPVRDEKGEIRIDVRPTMPLKDKQGHDYSEEWGFLEKETEYKAYPLAHKLIAHDQKTTLYNMIRWLKSNVFHAYTNQDGTSWDWDHYADGRQPDPLKQTLLNGKAQWLPANLERYFEERISGCHEPVLVLANMARSLNIPVMNINVEGHGITYLPTEDRFVHGDHLSNHPMVPTDLVPLTRAGIAGIKDEPMLFEEQKRLVLARFNNDITATNIIMSSEMNRKQNSLEVHTNVNGLPSDEVTAAIQKELPQYGLIANNNTYRLQATSLYPIRTLEELKKPDSNIW